jgi:ATP-binding cassette, subfamily B, bacterial
MSTSRGLTSARATQTTRASGRQAWQLLWSSSRAIGILVALWVVATSLAPAAVVVALGAVVGTVPNAISNGLGSPSGAALWLALGVAAVVYAFSLVLDPIGTALGTAARTRITSSMQQRLLAAVAGPVGTAHLEDPAVLDRLSRAEGSLTGFFPGDAPVTWAGLLSSRIAGIIGCLLLSLQVWWLGIVLLVVWLFVRWLVLRAVIRQATEFRSQAASMRYAWYLIGVGTRAGDAKEMRVFGLADFVAGRFGDEYGRAIRTASAGLNDLHRRVVIGFLLVLGAYGLALWEIVRQALDGGLGIAALAILIPMLAVTSSAGSISFDDITLTWALGAIPDVESLEAELGADELPGTDALGARPLRSIRFEGVRFRYPAAEQEVLHGVDLEFEAGRSTAIVGVNGAGKSTMVSLLSRLGEPTAGRITVDGEDIRTVRPTEWQRAVALMPQSPTRFPLSAYDNIAFGAIEHGDDRDGVREAARLAGFDDVVAKLPRGWDTVLSRQLPEGVDLSGGQWQRLALARSLFAARHGARILILDEPTAALDVMSEARFYEHFLDITKGLTTVVISHRFATVRRVDTICVLEGGVITERGSHDELVALGGTYAELYQLQARRFQNGGAE